MVNDQSIFFSVKCKDFRRFTSEIPDTVHPKVRIVQRSDNHYVSRRQQSYKLVKVEWNIVQPTSIVGEPRHVSRLRPSVLWHPL